MSALPIARYLAYGQAVAVYKSGAYAGEPFHIPVSVELNDIAVNPEPFYFHHEVLVETRIRQIVLMRLSLLMVQKATEFGCTNFLNSKDWVAKLTNISYTKVDS